MTDVKQPEKTQAARKQTGHDPKADKDETWENVIAIAVVLIIVIGIGWWVYARLNAPPAPLDAPAVNVPIGLSPVLGSENATVTVVEFSDFECPFCGEFARNDYKVIKERYVDTGMARIVFKQYPLSSIHLNAQKAAEASLCAEAQGRFWEYHDLLYENQDKLGIPDLKQYAAQLGLNTQEFNTCLDAGERAPEVMLDKQLGERIGVTGTPTFFFNGRKVVGVMTPEEFGSQIAQE